MTKRDTVGDVNNLTPHQREFLIARWLEDKGDEEAASSIEISVHTAYQWRKKAEFKALEDEIRANRMVALWILARQNVIESALKLRTAIKDKDDIRGLATAYRAASTAYFELQTALPEPDEEAKRYKNPLRVENATSSD